MTATEESRRTLACIMFTDMVGYTSLAQSNEEDALRVLERHNTLVRPYFQKHRGREIKTIGDSFLVEFESALDAANCAIEIQESLHGDNVASKEEWKIQLRIGIHLGDVVHKGEDVFGDAVNIASRIRPLAAAGGICLTRQVYDHLHNKIPVPMKSLGIIPLKNVTQSIEVFKVILPWESDEPKLVGRAKATRIAVLPFTNMSPNPSDEYFADGLTEELIDKLSQVKGLEVIARTSVMTYKNKDKKISEIAEELRVGTVIEGSVRKAGNKIRATVNLIDSTTESRLWSSRYDKDLDDIFAIQSDIAANVTGSIPASLGLDASTTEEKDTEDIVAYTYFLQARELFHESESSIRDALNLFEKATRRDPKLVRAYIWQAECYRSLGMFASIPFQLAIDEARKSISKALSIREDLAEAHATLSGIEMMEDNVARGEIEARRAIELNPNLADAYSNLANIMLVRGVIDESIALREKAYKLDPLEPWNMTSLGDEYFWSGREEEALEIWKISLKFAPYMTYDSMMDYYLKVGDYATAASTIQLLRNLEPGNAENEFWDGYLAAIQGDREKATRVIKFLEKSAEEGAVTINGEALIYCALGDLDKFFELERKANDTHRLSVSVLRYSPLAARARQDPRTRELLEKFEGKTPSPA